MRSVDVVILAPSLDLSSGTVQADKNMFIETLVPKLAVETFDVGVLRRFPRLNEVELDAVRVRPGIKRLADKLWPVIDSNHFG